MSTSPVAGSSSTDSNIAAWIGLDWADSKHAICLQAAGSSATESFVVEQAPEALHAWIGGLRRRFPTGPVAIALEQTRGSLFYALMNYDFLLLYPIAPHAAAAFRKALYPSGSKDDPTDAALLLEFVRKHRERLRPWKPDDVATRQLRLLIEHRRQFVDHRTALTNQLLAALKIYFPQALDYLGDLSVPWTWAFLERWPALSVLQKATRLQLQKFFSQHTRRSPEQAEALREQVRTAAPLTCDQAVIESHQLLVQSLVPQLQALASGLRRYDKAIEELFASHPDQAIFNSLPGAGAALGPRLLAAWGTDRGRFNSAGEMQRFCGIAPVLERSGKSRWVHWRWACPKFLRQTFHEFASHSRLWSPWARAYYEQMRGRGVGHHAAIRALAFKWIRIMYRCWKNSIPYDEQQYQQSMQRRGSRLCTVLPLLASKEALV